MEGRFIIENWPKISGCVGVHPFFLWYDADLGHLRPHMTNYKLACSNENGMFQVMKRIDPATLEIRMKKHTVCVKRNTHLIPNFLWCPFPRGVTKKFGNKCAFLLTQTVHSGMICLTDISFSVVLVGLILLYYRVNCHIANIKKN